MIQHLLEISLPNLPVHRIYAGGMDPNQEFAGPRLRAWHLLVL
jgi:hypothetical protein